MSCSLWMIGQFQWTYHEVYLHKPVPALNGGDILFFFLRGIPLMAALTLRPHRRRGEIQLRFGYLDFILLFIWWTFPLCLCSLAVDLCLTDGRPIQ